MTKMLPIESCRECKWRWVSGLEIMCRGRSGADRIITDIGIWPEVIPTWCELEDAPEDAPVAVPA